MVRFLPIGVLVVLVAAAIGFYFLRQSQTQSPFQAVNKQVVEISGKTAVESFAPVSTEDRLKTMEDAIIALAKKQGSIQTSSTATTDERLKSLEDNVTALKLQISQLQGNSSQTTSTSTKKSPVYIPLGWSGSTPNTTWTTITGQTITIDTNDYPGYTSVQFEAKIMNYQGNGMCFARLADKSGNGFIPSEVSASGTDYTWVSSGGFFINQGKNIYTVQLKTGTSGYAAQIADARLKINF